MTSADVNGVGSTRARADRTYPDEQARLRGGFGIVLAQERVARGFTQEGLAVAAGYRRQTLCELENGAVRPSESCTRRLAEALRPGGTAVDVARLDLVLQDAAGPSLRRWRRTRGWSARRARAYARARAELDAPAPDQAGAATLGRLLAGLDAEWRAAQ